MGMKSNIAQYCRYSLINDKAFSIISALFLPSLLLIDMIINSSELLLTANLIKYIFIAELIIITSIKYKSNISRVSVLVYGSSNIEIFMINIFERIKFILLMLLSLWFTSFFIDIKDYKLISIVILNILTIYSLNSIGLSIKTSMKASGSNKLIKRYILVFAPIIITAILLVLFTDTFWEYLFGKDIIENGISTLISLSILCAAIHFIEFKFFVLYKNYIDLLKYKSSNNDSKVIV